MKTGLKKLNHGLCAASTTVGSAHGDPAAGKYAAEATAYIAIF
jgi:hypothetical protein